MQTSLFESFIGEEKTGFRLFQLETYNWGTFHQRVWRMKTEGANALLTGDIGSGKSTLVDALTTLLVPHHRITYNKAAGAESKERTLASYIRGEYKNLKDDESQVSRAIALREKNTYSVLLGHFHNEGFEQSVTLAQVFWLKDQSRQVERFFVFSEKTLNIAEHFSGFGNDILDLKRRLRQLGATQVFETFKDYSLAFRSAFGIQHEQALELFYQTISMKTVGNLTDFVRLHMLEKGESASRIEELKKSFDNLSRAHHAVLEARQQIELLKPISETGTKIRDLESNHQGLVFARDSLGSYFAGIKVELLNKKKKDLLLTVEKLELRLSLADEKRNLLKQQEQELRESIRANGGGRLEALQTEINRLLADLPAFQKRHSEYEGLVQELNLSQNLKLSAALNPDLFLDNRLTIEQALAQIEIDLKKAQEKEIEAIIEFRKITDDCRELEIELNSLKERKSNIPTKNLSLRRRICEALRIPEQEIPFVGEHLQVEAEASAWTGAIERVLHGFALSLLVKENHYSSVSKYVDTTHLRGKLVYFRTRSEKNRQKGSSSNSLASVHANSQENSLVRKIEIKAQSVHYDWLQNQLNERFDYACCERIEDFHALPFALTQNGQLKTGGTRHEKDDRASIQDSSQYVLGWENEVKIRALTESRQTLAIQASEKASALESIKKEIFRLNQARDFCKNILGFKDFAALDWRPLSLKIENLSNEKKLLQESSSQLGLLQEKLEEILVAARKSSKDYEDGLEKKGTLSAELKQTQEQNLAAQEVFDSRSALDRARDFPIIQRFQGENTNVNVTLTLVQLEKGQSELRALIQGELDREKKRIERLREDLIRRMLEFIKLYPAQSKEMDGNIEALDEFVSLLKALHEEDLPRHEEKFRKLLNEGAINGVALFRNQLEKEGREIENKIALINRSLFEIEYSPGTYIELICDRSTDLEVRQFLSDMKACTEHGVSDDTLYDEVKFLRVKQIMDRFNGRDNLTELDRRWTTKVTDVRNWYVFSARETYTETGKEKEFYSDSSGKSGGQKEKLAYTVLASALAYQFGLEWNTKRSRTFRFVIIDEAFGRGSDESARFGLELFRKLNLQLLVVTPLQKIHVIEDYVNSVHFVHNEAGRDSQIRSLTIGEYQDEKKRRRSIEEPRANFE
jgi:uncharacterized protein YPO0396